ncbi:MAG: hypothetical protein KAH32_08735 [Chlamydiia bacterium]|nr:hypothetical protein [Chlamydiia bacterium]
MFNHQDIREDVVVVQEKMKLNPQFIKTKTSGEEYATHDGGYTLKLQRNLRDDTFNIMFKDPYYDANTKHFLSQLTDADIFANVNGVETSLSKMHAHSRTSSNGKNENSFFVHRSMINNIKFRDIKSATFGIKNITYPNDLAYRMSIYPQFEALRDNIRISKDKVLDIQTINAMTINIKNPHATNGNANYKNEEMLVTKSYTHTLLVPRELRRMGKNVTVFDVFVYNDILKKVDGYGVESSENDYALKKGEIKTTSFKNKLNLVVNDIHGDTTNGIIEKISP